MTGIIEVDGKEAESAGLIFELADLRLENKRLRAELKNGNDALEDENEDLGRINDKLVAENGRLRAANKQLTIELGTKACDDYYPGGLVDVAPEETMNVNEPIEVTPQHEPTTPLQAALDALGRGDGHISPRQAEKLLAYIKRLKRHRDRNDSICHNLADQLSALEPAEPPHYDESLARVWDNPTDEAYNE